MAGPRGPRVTDWIDPFSVALAVHLVACGCLDPIDADDLCPVFHHAMNRPLRPKP
jgi:hypothetical protein